MEKKSYRIISILLVAALVITCIIFPSNDEAYAQTGKMKLNKKSVVLTVKKTATVKAVGSYSKLKVIASKKKIVKVSVKGKKITIKGLKKGSVKLIVKGYNKKGKLIAKGAVTIKVNAAKKSTKNTTEQKTTEQKTTEEKTTEQKTTEEKTKSPKISGGKIYDASGNLVKKNIVKIDGKNYYADKNGKVVKSTKIICDGIVYSADASGVLSVVKNNITVIDGKNYITDGNGKVIKNTNVICNGKIYSADNSGVAALVTDKIVTVNDKDYYVDSNGNIQKNVKITYSGKTYQADSEGVLTEVEERSIPKKWDDNATYTIHFPEFTSGNSFKGVQPGDENSTYIETTNYVTCMFCGTKYADPDEYFANDTCAKWTYSGSELNNITKDSNGNDCLCGDYLVSSGQPYSIYTVEFSSGGYYFTTWGEMRQAGYGGTYSIQVNPAKTITTRVYPIGPTLVED